MFLNVWLPCLHTDKASEMINDNWSCVDLASFQSSGLPEVILYIESWKYRATFFGLIYQTSIIL